MRRSRRRNKVKAVVVLSGGQDSALCLALACRRFGSSEVAAITFSYGQRHAVELKSAKRLAKKFGITTHNVVKLGFYSQITSNALMTPGAEIRPVRGPRTANRVTPPNTVVEGRNAIFLQIAAVWAKSLGATSVYTGVSQTDYSGYPDCRAPFIRAQQRSIRLALDYPITIVTPFMYKTKAEEWALADRLGLLDYINTNTVTCYDGVPGAGCGKCPACRLRNRGLAEYLKTKRPR